MKKVGIIGAGAWGIALGISLEKNGCAVCLWHHDKQKLSKLNSERKTSKLDGIIISEKIKLTDSLSKVFLAGSVSGILIGIFFLNDYSLVPLEKFENIDNAFLK